MRMKSLIATSAAAALVLAPAGALARGGPPADRGGGRPAETKPGHDRRPATTPAADLRTESQAPAAPATSNGKRRAYGRYCKGQSKKHVKGTKGTPFSRCVRAMAKLADGEVKRPAKACKGLSKKHVKGRKGTPFSRCVSGGRKLLKDREGGGAETPTTYADPFGDDD
jgi:hypothetical protein